MEKRLILAMSLSLLLLLAWSALFPRPQLIENKGIITKNSLTNDIPQERPPSSIQPETLSAHLINYEQGNFEVIFVEPLAAIKEVKFKTYPNSKFSLKSGFLLNDKSLSFSKYNSSANEVSFLHADQQKRVIKKFIFPNSNYDMWLEIDIQNIANAPIAINWPLVIGILEFSSQNVNTRYQDVTIGTKEKALHVIPRKSLEFTGVKFLGLRDRYFCAIVESQEDFLTSYIKKTAPQNFEIGVTSKELLLAPGQQVKEKFHIYLGPQELHLINNINPNWLPIVNYGTFDFISQILLQLLQFFNSLVHNWGWAIVLLSLAIYIVLFPLTLKQMRSMKEMQALQPKIEELRNLYKDNPQRLQKEQMELFQKHKVNPFGGCLPLLLQMPIFFALYQTLMRSVFLRGAGFLWIKDLSEPDKLFSLPFPKPFEAFNLLPILMTIGMFLQQKISTGTTTNATSAGQQKTMMIMMPLLFGFIFYSMPAGLVLYWFVNSTLMLVNQFYQLRINQSK